MERLRIVLNEDRTAFTPGQAAQGAVTWNLDANPRYLELSLLWYTAGKGTRDAGLVQTLRFDEPGVCGSKDFSFPLPEGPYSFSGKLISLVWAMELTVSPGAETVRREITLSPTGREILLGQHQ
jgi:hypothetical protein